MDIYHGSNFLGILKAVIGIRISEEAEEMGVDVSECGEWKLILSSKTKS